MSTTSENKGLDRRSFLQGIGWGAGTAGLAAVALGGRGQTAEAGPTDAKPAAGYRETDHVLRAYEVARF